MVAADGNLIISISSFVLPPHGLDDQLVAVRVDGVEHSPVPAKRLSSSFGALIFRNGPPPIGAPSSVGSSSGG